MNVIGELPTHTSKRKPSTLSLSCFSSQALVNISLCILLIILIFSVHRLHATQCTLSTVESEAVTPPSNHSSKPTTSFDSATQGRINRPHPPCSSRGTQAKTFFMVFMGHSGSTALTTELKSHPSIHVEEREMVDHQPVFNSTEALQMTRDFFDRGIAMGKTPGFKIRPTHILRNPEGWRALMKEYDTRVIWNYRQNIIKLAIAQYAIQFYEDKTSVEGLKKNITAEERCKLGVGCRYPIADPKLFYERLVKARKNQQLIFKAIKALYPRQNACVREVPYEDYLYHRDEVMSDLFKFLGIAHAKTMPKRYKATSDNMCEVVSNWKELCRNFYGCLLLKPMMDDVRNGCYCEFNVPETKYCSFPSF